MVERTVQALGKVLFELWTGNVHFCTICEITFLVGDPWKSNVVFEKSPWKVLKKWLQFFGWALLYLSIPSNIIALLWIAAICLFLFLKLIINVNIHYIHLLYDASFWDCTKLEFRMLLHAFYWLRALNYWPKLSNLCCIISHTLFAFLSVPGKEHKISLVRACLCFSINIPIGECFDFIIDWMQLSHHRILFTGCLEVIEVHSVELVILIIVCCSPRIKRSKTVTKHGKLLYFQCQN